MNDQKQQSGLNVLQELLAEGRARRQADATTFEQLDMDECMLCHAHGEDKRSLNIECFYAIHEVVPEALDLATVREESGYFLRICKACRGALLDRLAEWRDERVALRGLPKDHDGHVLGEEYEYGIPVRVNGRIVYMTEEEWRARRDAEVSS